VVICLGVWKLSGPDMATIASTAAILIAGLPALVELWRKPQRELAHVWLGYTAANVLSCAGGAAWTLQDRFVPAIFAVQTLTLAMIGYRRPPGRDS
jgi:hypothetical protein